MLTKLFTQLNAMSPLSEGFESDLKKRVLILSLPKNHCLVEIAKVADHAYFLNSGFAMAFRYIGGRKHVEELYKAGSIVVSPKSFFSRMPSVESIQLLEDSEVLHLSYEDLIALFSAHPVAHKLCEVTLSQYYEESRERIHDLQYLSAVERYEKLERTFPKVEQLLPQEYVASYLGIAPQSLSRIKREQRAL